MEISLTETLEKVLIKSVDKAVRKHIVETIEQLTLDPSWIAKIESLVKANVSQKIERKLSNIDMQTFLAENLSAAIDSWQENKRKINAGVEDTASELQLSIQDGVVVAHNNFVTQNVEATSDVSVGRDLRVKNTVTVDHLIVKKSVNVDNRSWNEISDRAYQRVRDDLTDDFQNSLIKGVLENSSDYNIDFASVSIGGDPLVEGNVLNNRIQKTGITRTGKLESLEVAGETLLNETVAVVKKRVGINTERPENTFSLWDEEVNVAIGKQKKNTAFVGTGRKNGLQIGVNNEKVIDIDAEGKLFVNNLTVDRWQIRFESSVPGYRGTRGDITFNSNPRDGEPFAWVCTGNFNWKALRAD